MVKTMKQLILEHLFLQRLVKVIEPVFESQTKTKLGSTEIET